ncbi:MarR family winged helix-turn-helix transcriptional regulator [Microtetraspora malaysiensis]|uniref:MarR family winged helix-turn-helix transcriptional regulator n=1 Tax=Microtetraspora malaysiensis TaxID=161358 RepID=UPI0008356B59|nr:MarR family transcriptional regulator [Microtetraspora malaysiensis]
MNAENSPSPPPAGRDYSLGPLLRLAGQRASAAFSEGLVPLGIEGRHFGVLLNLVRHGPVNQRKIGALTGSDKSSIVRTVDDLEARGLAVRRPAAGDRRAYAVEITDAGRELFAHAEAVAMRVNGELLAHLTAEEQDHLRHLLRRFVSP